MAVPRLLSPLRTASAKALRLALSPITHLALALQFRRLLVLHPENVPRTGGLLLVANHPATWMDVLLLGQVLGRDFHFLAQEEQFRPWTRGVLLDAYGTLPLSSREYRPDAEARNEETFRRCERLFDRGEAVAVFPEGISRVDRGLMPLKHGAARLALSYAAGRDARSFALVPVGIHYSDRTAFRSDVTVSVGAAIAARDLRLSPQSDPEDAARRLTERMTEAMRALVLDIENDRARQFAVLESLASGRRGSLGLERARRLAWSLRNLERIRPEEFARIGRRASALERLCAALRIPPSAFAARAAHVRARALAALLVGLLPAAAGVTLHAVPALLTHVGAKGYASEPSRVAFARLTAGTLFYCLTLGIGGALLLGAARVSPVWLPAAWTLFAVLGLFALWYGREARVEIQRWRLARLSRRYPRLMRRAQRVERLLRADVERLLA